MRRFIDMEDGERVYAEDVGASSAPDCRCGDGPCECPARCERCDRLTDDGLSDSGLCEPCVIAMETRGPG